MEADAQRPRTEAADLSSLPTECIVHIAGFLSLRERLTLSLVSRQLFLATRSQGARLWDVLPISFNSPAKLRQFAAWHQRSACAPSTLLLQQDNWQQGEPEKVLWEEVVATAQLVLPSLQHLMVRWEDAATAGDWIRGGTNLRECGLYCGKLMLCDAMGSLTQLRDLSLESMEAPLTFASAASLPPCLTKLFAVESHVTEVPEALSRLSQLECAYLSRNPLAPDSLERLAPLPRLQLLSLIGCWFDRPPRQLAALTALRALYLDYNNFGSEAEQATQDAFREALAPLSALQALGLSHNYLDSWPEAVELLPRLRVLYLECNPGIARLPPSAAAVLARLRVLSCDCNVLFSNPAMFVQAGQLEHLFVSGSGLMWHPLAATATSAEVQEALAAMPSLQRLTFVVQTQKEEAPSVEVAQLMLTLPRRCPHLTVEALDSEQFFGVTLTELDAIQ